ncbi:MAG: NADH:flavin oxidoreductase [Bacteroidetes bacterium]|nr:NADH:flavin oxidoreductase [Bacteroidota bacterium]MCL5025014.1 NADH:flavin oxidoreductase [Chloroflexota bacterium]
MLFSPFRVKGLELKNRLVMPPIVTIYCGPNGEVTDRLVAYLAERAASGIGLVIAEAAFVEMRGRGFPGELGIHDDALLPGLRRLVSTLKACGARTAIQLMHAGRRTSTQAAQERPVAPSAIPTVNGEKPRALRVEEIEALPEAYGAAARRAAAAGFDAVEVHMAHGYLLNEFISPISNRRRDRYGGSLENRLRLPLAVLRRVREVLGPEYPLFVRISADEFVEGGMRLPDWQRVAPILVANGADLIDVSSGIPESTVMGSAGLLSAPPRTQPGYMLHLAEGIKRAVSVPVIAAGRIHDPALAERALEEGKADLIGVARGLLADPAWAKKAAEGRAGEIVMCTMCGRCHRDLRSYKPITCPINPRLGLEYQAPAEPAKA